MDLSKPPAIPTPKFGADNAAFKQQWAEWRREVKSVHNAFGFLMQYVKAETIRRCKTAKELREAMTMHPPGSDEVITEAIRRCVLRLDGGAVNKDGMTEWEEELCRK